MSHSFVPDPRNEQVLVYLNGAMIPRAQASVSVFDSGFLMGDGIWESFRVRQGHIGFLDAHLDRLFEGAAALMIDIGMSREDITDAIRQTLVANQMTDAVHLRLMITRGIRSTPYQDPRVVIGGPTVVIVPEYKRPTPRSRPLRLFTVHVRRGRADVQDPGINNHAKLNCITACIQATQAGADEGLMLDPHGFVATCNSTHFFIVRGGEVWTSTGDYCLPGITRAAVIRCCKQAGIPVFERNFSLTRVYGADEAFITGTFGGLTTVGEIDGRTIGTGTPGPMVARLQALYAALSRTEGAAV